MQSLGENRLLSVVSQLDDTRLAVGGEAMQAATQTYSYVKAGAKNTPGLKPIAEQLGQRFKGGGKTEKTKTSGGST